jgi:hypothetical protein
LLIFFFGVKFCEQQIANSVDVFGSQFLVENWAKWETVIFEKSTPNI